MVIHSIHRFHCKWEWYKEKLNENGKKIWKWKLNENGGEGNCWPGIVEGSNFVDKKWDNITNVVDVIWGWCGNGRRL